MILALVGSRYTLDIDAITHKVFDFSQQLEVVFLLHMVLIDGVHAGNESPKRSDAITLSNSYGRKKIEIKNFLEITLFKDDPPYREQWCRCG